MTARVDELVELLAHHHTMTFTPGWDHKGTWKCTGCGELIHEADRRDGYTVAQATHFRHLAERIDAYYMEGNRW